MTHTVILAGGWGRRFWPKSRRKHPKQLLSLGKRPSPLQNLFSLIRAEVPVGRIWVVANKAYGESLRAHLPSLPQTNLLLEPLSKNTAAAVGLAAAVIRKSDPHATIVVLYSDYIIERKKKFWRIVRKACAKARQENVLVAVGIQPDRPADEFGYLKIVRDEKCRVQNGKMYKVKRFVEKPSRARARRFLEDGGYLWNSGIFVWKAESIYRTIQKHLPRLYSGLKRIEKLWGSPRYEKCLLKEYKRFKNISLDYAILEKAKNLYVLAGDFTCRDLGSWHNFCSNLVTKDKQGNIIHGLHKGINTRDSLVVSEDGHLIGTVGVRGLIIVQTPFATLICRKDRAQDVKRLTQILEKDKHLNKYL